MTDHLTRLLFAERGYTFSNPERAYTFSTLTEQRIVSDIKEKFCYVALDFKQETEAAATSRTLDKQYTLPDGLSVCTIGKERFTAPEALFQPSAADFESPGIHVTVFDSIMRCPFNARQKMFANIVMVSFS